MNGRFFIFAVHERQFVLAQCDVLIRFVEAVKLNPESLGRDVPGLHLLLFIQASPFPPYIHHHRPFSSLLTNLDTTNRSMISTKLGTMVIISEVHLD